MTTEASTAPIAARDRIATLDLLRGIAICGILLMNIPEMGALTEGSVPGFPARWNANWISWGLQKVFAEGTMRGLFELLFGAGMLLILRHAETREPKVSPFDVWARRCWALMMLGVVQWAIFFWWGEILWAYGLCGLFLLAFRVARPRTLLIAAAILLVAYSGFSAQQEGAFGARAQAGAAAAAAKAAGKTLTDAQESALRAVEEIRKALHPSDKQKSEIYQKRTHLLSLESYSWDQWQGYNLGVPGWLGVLEGVSFMLIGMALFRTGILTGDARASTYAWMMAIGYGGGIGLRAYFLYHGARTGYDYDPASISQTYVMVRAFLYQPGRLLITLGHVGLIVTLFRAGALGKAWPARAMGRMALTVYSLQSILTSILFYAFGLLGRLDFAELMATAAAIWVVTGLFCVAWLARFEMGPAEWVLRGIAYGRFGRIARKDREQPAGAFAGDLIKTSA
jgi:uncharacterized protein